jgi:L-2-hydroxycarboxylate dehydrogenase (NAD+)
MPELNRNSNARRVPVDVLASFAGDALVACGLSTADAWTAAGLITEADLTGVDTHGIFRLPQYVEALLSGAVNPTPAITCAQTAPATALVDGDNGLGHLVVGFSARKAIELAHKCGLAWVGVRNSNHAGAGAIYAAMAAKAGMIGIYAAVSGVNHMAPWGGREPLLGTNPLAIGIPTDGAPVILDIATSVASFGAIKTHTLEGKPLPEGWMISRSDGRALTDPARVTEGLLLPFGGYKGSGLALTIGLLAGTMNGAAFGRDVGNAAAQTQLSHRPSNTGQFFLALDVKRFMGMEAFMSDVRNHLTTLRASQKLPEFGSIRIPGEGRELHRQERLHKGVPLSGALLDKLDKFAGTLNLIPLSGRIEPG